MIDYPSPVIAPNSTVDRRTPPRPADQQQVGYLDQFDSDTVVYDVIWDDADRVLRMPGPSMRGSVFADVAWFVDGAPVLPTRVDGSRASRLSVSYRTMPWAVTAQFSEGVEVKVTPVRARPYLFYGLNVLLTVSKDNPLPWVIDWVTYHVQHHGANAVLLYDNGSTAYTLEELNDALTSIPGLQVVVVMAWRFKYGPQGGVWAGHKDIKWDSDYCQIGALDDARWRWLQHARAVLSIDVDELVVSEQSVFDLVAEHGYVRFDGQWIESVPLAPILGQRRHRDFAYVDTTKGRCGFKWAAQPEWDEYEQWTAHSIYGVDHPPAYGVELAHFLPINSDWKRKRAALGEFDPSRHALHAAPWIAR